LTTLQSALVGASPSGDLTCLLHFGPKIDPTNMRP
jgi:hypothetical protein